MPKPLIHTHCTSIRIPENWHAQMHAMAKHLGVSTSEIYRQAVSLYLKTVRTNPKAHNPDLLRWNLHRDRRVSDGIQGWVVRAEASVNQLNVIPICRYDHLAVEVWVRRTRRLDCVGNCHSESGCKGSLSAMRLRNVALKNHRLFENPLGCNDTDVRLYGVEPRIAEDSL